MQKIEKTMSKDAWVSDAMHEYQLLKNGTCDMWENDADAALELISKVKAGEALPAEAFPTKCYNNIERRHLKNLPPYFQFASLWLVTSEMADVLRPFNLGKSADHPVELYQ